MDPEVQEESVRLDSSPIVQILRQELNIFTGKSYWVSHNDAEDHCHLSYTVSYVS